MTDVSPGALRIRRASGERTRASLLDAALLLWSRLGEASVTMDAVAREAGRTRGIVYHHFADRGELLAAAREHLYEQLKDLFASRGPTARDPYGFVAGLVVDSPELILTYIQELALGNPRDDSLIRAGVDHYRELADEGRFNREVDPYHAAIATVSMWLAAVLTVNLGRSPTERRQQARQFAMTFRNIMERGLLRPDPDAEGGCVRRSRGPGSPGQPGDDTSKEGES